MHFILRGGGALRRFAGHADNVGRIFELLPADGRAVVAAQRERGDALFLMRGAGGGFRCRVIDHAGPGALGHRVGARRDYDADTARRLLALYAAEDPAWRKAIAWKRGLLDLPAAILAPAILIVCAALYLAIAGATGGLRGWSWRYLPNLAVGFVLVAALFAYADWFFRALRRRLAAWLGARLGLHIVETQTLGLFSRPGMWESADGGLVSELKVMLLDLAILFAGLMVPIFAIGTAIVVAALPIMA